MVKLRLLRKLRAQTLGRYLNFLTAARTRSLVRCGISWAVGESLRTTEIVAGDKSRYFARNFKLMGGCVCSLRLWAMCLCESYTTSNCELSFLGLERYPTQKDVSRFARKGWP